MGALNAPIFDRITIHLSSRYHGGGTFTIETANNNRENIHIQFASLNGQQLTTDQAGPDHAAHSISHRMTALVVRLLLLPIHVVSDQRR